MSEDFPALDRSRLLPPDARSGSSRPSGTMHPPRILLLYGSLRERSYSRFLTQEADAPAEADGRRSRASSTRTACRCPIASAPIIPRCGSCANLSLWSEGQVWCSPERHGAITGVFKNQIDWLPLAQGARPADAGPNAGGDAGLGRLAVLQRRQHAARARPLDADGHHPQPVVACRRPTSSSTRPAG